MDIYSNWIDACEAVAEDGEEDQDEDEGDYDDTKPSADKVSAVKHDESEDDDYD